MAIMIIMMVIKMVMKIMVFTLGIGRFTLINFDHNIIQDDITIIGNDAAADNDSDNDQINEEAFA